MTTRATGAVTDWAVAVARDRPPYSDDGGRDFVVHSAASAPLCGVYGWQPQPSLTASLEAWAATGKPRARPVINAALRY